MPTFFFKHAIFEHVRNLKEMKSLLPTLLLVVAVSLMMSSAAVTASSSFVSPWCDTPAYVREAEYLVTLFSANPTANNVYEPGNTHIVIDPIFGGNSSAST